MLDALFRQFKVSTRIVITAVIFCLFLLLLFPVIRENIEISRRQLQIVIEQELPVSSLLIDSANLIASSELRVTQALADRRANVLLTESGALIDLEVVQERLNQAEALLSQSTEEPSQSPLADVRQSLAEIRIAVTGFDASLAAGDLDVAAQQAAQVRSAGDQARSELFSLADQRRQILDARTTAVTARWNDQYTALTAIVYGMFPLAILFALLVGRTITRPIAQIQKSIEAFTEGNLDAVATSPGRSEITSLGQSLNRLFTRLSQSDQEMRNDMEERSVALARRSIQLQTAAQITSDAAAFPELESLLNRVSNLVRERFDFYYVGIFLLDADGRYAIMRAGSGEAGRILRSRGFRLRVGDPNLIGQVTLTGEERIVSDVATDFTHQREPLLPLTRSEAVIPLKIGLSRIIGVLDVQSAVVNAFDSETLSVLQILGDQLTVVIENNRLKTALEQAQEEAATLLQRYTQETWSGLAAGQRLSGYRFDLVEVQPYRPTETNLQVRTALKSAGISGIRAELLSLENGGSLLRVPLVMYNEVVGVIGLEEEDPTRTWSDDEIRILEALSTQISLALENARLLDEAQRRTNQLRLLQEVTAAAAANTELSGLLVNVSRTLRTGLDLDFVGATVFSNRLPGFEIDRLRVVALRGESSPFAQLEALSWDIHTVPAVLNLIESGRSLLLEVQSSARLLGNSAFLLEQVGVTYVLLQPILYRGQVIGLLDLSTSLENAPFGAETLSLMDQVALQLSSAVEVALSFAQTTLRAARERQMATIVQRIRATLDISTILRTAADEIRGSLTVPAKEGVVEDRQPEVIVRLGAQPNPASEAGTAATQKPVFPPDNIDLSDAVESE